MSNSDIYPPNFDINKAIAARITFIREKNGQNRKCLSHLLGFGDSYLSSIETGRKRISPERLLIFCNYFNMSLSEFFNFYDNKDITADGNLIEFKSFTPAEQQDAIKYIRFLRSNK